MPFVLPAGSPTQLWSQLWGTGGGGGPPVWGPRRSGSAGLTRSATAGHGEGRLHRGLRGVAGVHLDLPGLDHEVTPVVVEPEVAAVERERDPLRLLRLEGAPLEAPQPADRLRDARHGVVEVELHDLVARDITGVGHRHA